MDFYTLDQLAVTGVSLGSIRELSVHNEPGSHGVMEITAQIQEEDEETLLYGMASRQPGALWGGENLLFAGVLTGVEFLRRDEVRLGRLTFRTEDCQMDIQKKSRSFQDTSLTLSGLLDLILKDYPGADYCLSVPDQAIGRLLVQYKETDWEFLKRVFSEYYAPLGALMSQEGIRIYAGVPALAGQWEYELEAVEKSEAEVRRFAAMGAAETDFVDLRLLSGSCQDIFASLTLEGRALAVRTLDWELRKGRLECRYALRPGAGIGAYPIYPVSLVGIALEGRILEVKGNLVRIHMDIDGPCGGKDAYWFPYATMSAALDGSGWYYMPEAGDRVRVEFPDKYAQDALVINSASVYDAPSGGEDSMGNPAVKYLSNCAGQKMSLGPQGVDVSAGSSGITVDNSGAVSIWGNNEVIIKAEEKITLRAKSITVKGAEEVKAANEAGTGAELTGDLKLTGAEVLIN